ncbi:uncharacterized protein LOC144180220 [Haemaphysalis longicornis]
MPTQLKAKSAALQDVGDPTQDATQPHGSNNTPAVSPPGNHPKSRSLSLTLPVSDGAHTTILSPPDILQTKGNNGAPTGPKPKIKARETTKPDSKEKLQPDNFQAKGTNGAPTARKHKAKSTEKTKRDSKGKLQPAAEGGGKEKQRSRPDKHHPPEKPQGEEPALGAVPTPPVASETTSGLPSGAPAAPPADQRRAQLALLAAVTCVMLTLIGAAFLASLGPYGDAPRLCSSNACAGHAALLDASLNRSVDPCQDFHGYVCSSWESTRTKPLASVIYEQ